MVEKKVEVWGKMLGLGEKELLNREFEFEFIESSKEEIIIKIHTQRVAVCDSNNKIKPKKTVIKRLFKKLCNSEM